MELKEDFINIQGIFLSVEKSAGSLNRIKHRGGHEKTILNLVTELHKFLSSKKYIKDNNINEAFEDQLKDICLFLVLNTEIEPPLEEPEFQHLINIMPQLSTCILANLIIGLDLSNQFCKALHRFDLNIVALFMIEMIPCIKKCKPKIHIQNAYEFLKLIVIKMSLPSEEKGMDGVEKLTDAAAQMLLNLTGLHGEQAENVHIDSVYRCMGFTLFNLLDLTLMCDEKNGSLSRLIEKLIKTCCSIMMAVTIDVFCCWAEVDLNGEVLQTLIAGKSYMFINKYQKFPIAKELINMLGTIAQKPKSINELIQKADVPTMISMINKENANQKQWFTALLNTQVLKCENSIRCIDRWAHLCSVGDVSRLLNLSLLTKDEFAKKVVIKCASTLEYEELVLVATRYFHQNGLSNNFNDDVRQQFVVLFNKIKDKTVEEEFCKELHLLILQNPQQSLAYIFSECLKNTFYSTSLVIAWPSLREVLNIGDVGVNILRQEISNNLPGENSCKNHTELFNALINSGVYSIEKIALDVIMPPLLNSYNEKKYDLLRYELEILKELYGNIVLNEETEVLFNLLFDIMKSCRCTFLKFDTLTQEVTRQTVDVIGKWNIEDFTFTAQPIKCEEDFFAQFYKRKILERDLDYDVIKHFFAINFDNHAEVVAHLIKILPLCVTPEWILIFSSLISFRGTDKTAEMLCDVAILLCELVNSQETKTEEVKSMTNALKYCLQNVGVVIKECIQPKVNDLKADVSLTKNVCRLLKEIPAGELKSEEGLSLASLLSEVSLKALRPNKKFACLVASINDSYICKMLAQKILS